MNIQEQQQLQKLHHAGYVIYIFGHPYVDSPVSSIHEDSEGSLAYSSQVFSDVPLAKVSFWHVQVSKPVENWMEEAVE